MRRQHSLWFKVGVVATAVLLASCGTVPLRQPDFPALLGYEVPAIEDAEWLDMTPEMKTFVEEYSRADHARHSRAWALAYAALDPYILDFSYDPRQTLTAAEAFQQRRGNCLTFSALFVAMARDAGLDARFQEVIIPPKWSAVNDTLLVSKHVNAIVSDKHRDYVIDVSRRQTSGRDIIRQLSDREALAQYALGDDGDGGEATSSHTIVVDNVAPTATFNFPATAVDEGSPINLSLSDPTDPSSVDTAAGFEYAFDFGDGYDAFGVSASAALIAPDDSVRTVKGKIRDKDGAVTEYTGVVTIVNVDPTANPDADDVS